MTAKENGWLRPGIKNIDTKEDYKDTVASFVRNTSLRFLQLAYSQRDEGNFRYQDDEEYTEIKIADQHAFQLEATDTRPAIIAVRGQLAWQNVGMNEGMQELDRRTGVKTSTDLINGGVAFTCLSRVGLEAETIASEVFNLFKFFRRTLKEQGFFNIRSMSLGPEQLVEAPGEPKLFLVSVLLSYQVQDRWVLTPQAATKLRRLVIEGFAKVRGEEGDGDKLFQTEITKEED